MRVPTVSAVLIGLGLAACARAGEDEAPAAGAGEPRAGRVEQAIDVDTPEYPGTPESAVTSEGAGTGDLGSAGDAGWAEAPNAAPGERPSGAPTDTIVLTSRGPELAFYPERVSARSGSYVILRYQNGGELPHNFVLVRNEEAIDALVTAAYEASSTDYVPVDMRDDLIVFSPLISPGGAVDLEVVIPPPGEYTYICLFPGHAQMMLGTLRSLP